MPPAELLKELRGSQPFLDSLPDKGVPDNLTIHKIGSVVQDVLEILGNHEETSEDIRNRLDIVYGYTSENLSSLVIVILMESRILNMRTQNVNGLISGCKMVVDALLDHFDNKCKILKSWESFDWESGDFSEAMADKYGKMNYHKLKNRMGKIILFMKSRRGYIEDKKPDRFGYAMAYIACLAEVSYMFGVIHDVASEKFDDASESINLGGYNDALESYEHELTEDSIESRIILIRGVLEELLRLSMSFIDSVKRSGTEEEEDGDNFISRFLDQADSVCGSLSVFLTVDNDSLGSNAFKIKVDTQFLPEELS